MNKHILRNVVLAGVMVGGFVLLDFFIDRLFFPAVTNTLHILLTFCLGIVTFILITRALENRRRAEESLMQGRGELEQRVRDRTSELEQANKALQLEMIERLQAEQETKRSFVQIDQARQQAVELASELKLANNRLRGILATLPVGLVIVNTEGEIVLANLPARSLMGSTVSGTTFDFLGEPPMKYMDGSIIPAEDLPISRALRRGETISGLEVLIDRRDGSQVYALVAASPVKDESERVVNAIQIIQDISDLKQVVQDLRASEETARALMNASSESALLVDTEGIVLAVNETAARRLNTTVSKLVGSLIFDFFSKEIADLRRTYLTEVLSSCQPAHFEDERDGMSFDINIYPVCDSNGNVIRMATFAQDVTERKRAERVLRESEERYRTQFDNFSEPTTVWDRNGILLMQNLVSARNMNGNREDFLGKNIRDLFGDAASDYLQRMERVIASGVAEYQEDEVVLPTVGRRIFWTCMQRVTNTDGQFAVQILSYDITDRKKIEEALRTSEAKFSTVFQSSPDAIAIVKISDGSTLDINEAFTKITGYSREDVIGKKWTDLSIVTASAGSEMIGTSLLESGSVSDLEIDFNARDGTTGTVLLSLIEIDINGEQCGLAIAHDITSRKRSEKALKLVREQLEVDIQQRIAMEERQRLARELHDSVSQALYGISLGTHTALTLIDTDRQKVLEALNYVLTLAQAGLTEMRALIFELRPESLEVEGLVAAITKQAAALRARHGIEVNLNLCDEPDIPFSVKEAIYRITQEAIQNAVKHSRTDHLDVNMICEDGAIRLEVCDNGVGFDALAVFPGHLGLRSMRERATNVGGKLEIVSAGNCGTQVRAWIPLHPEEVSRQN